MAIPRSALEDYRGDVCYLGERNDVPAFLGITDVFVLPSYREGIPRVLLEAGAMGVPVIATETAGCREVVRHGETGLLVPAREVDRLARAMGDLIDSKALRLRLGEGGQRRIREAFSLDKVADTYAEIYQRVLHESQSKDSNGTAVSCLRR